MIPVKLSDLAQYSNIIIQCHDIPDADTVGAGYALQRFLQDKGVQATLLYGGIAPITKPNLRMLIEMLDIPILYTDTLPTTPDLLITVDCQWGAGNVTSFPLAEGTPFMVIDHHRPEIAEGNHTEIRSNLGSCSTLVWDMLRKEDWPMDDKVQNALFYGLYTDTNGLSEVRHPLDRDLSEQPNDAGMIRRLKNAAITLDELDIIGDTLDKREFIENIGVLQARPCDPNLLGFTSDIAQQVASFDCCVVFCEQKHGLKLSIRSSVREIMASDLAAFVCRGVGSGGGNMEKAGGFMGFGKIEEAVPGTDPVDYLKQRIRDYCDNYDLIYAGKHNIDFDSFSAYRKRPIPFGYVQSTDIFPVDTRITIRALEGDVDTKTSDDICVMIGVEGEVWPIKRARLEETYYIYETPYREQAEYSPAVLNRNTGERRELLPLARACVSKSNRIARATELTKDTKVFTSWDLDKYYFGSKGDFLMATEGDYDDCYIVRRDIFFKTYASLDENEEA